jgi:hypothetical protein
VPAFDLVGSIVWSPLAPPTVIENANVRPLQAKSRNVEALRLSTQLSICLAETTGTPRLSADRSASRRDRPNA